jgi:hypothetical protein
VQWLTKISAGSTTKFGPRPQRPVWIISVEKVYQGFWALRNINYCLNYVYMMRCDYTPYNIKLFYILYFSEILNYRVTYFRWMCMGSQA